MRNGELWSRVAVFNMMPRLIEVGPRLFFSEDWKRRCERLSRLKSPEVPEGEFQIAVTAEDRGTTSSGVLAIEQASSALRPEEIIAAMALCRRCPLRSRFQRVSVERIATVRTISTEN